jgi:xanthine dehydrogenase YagS FAD-binding subunit
MKPFSYRRVNSPVEAIEAVTTTRQSGASEVSTHFIAGGTNMLDYMKLGVTRPDELVDINGLGKHAHGSIEATADGLRLGALARMADAQDHPAVKNDYPVIAETLKLAASQQIRNMASLSGNILQRTRCEYFRETSWPCNKRSPGTGCSAFDGVNREHAILGGSPDCIATYHGDFAQALIALDASIECLGASGRRRIAFADLHRRPGTTPHIETVLNPGELIIFIDVPAGPHTRRSHYVKIRDRESYQFALASAAVALDLDRTDVRDVRIALGGVATVPWRAREAEQVLRGKILDETSARAAAEAAFAHAEPRRHNAFKIPLGKAVLVRALLEAQAMKV